MKCCKNMIYDDIIEIDILSCYKLGYDVTTENI